jgi:hypothetical protein
MWKRVSNTTQVQGKDLLMNKPNYMFKQQADSCVLRIKMQRVLNMRLIHKVRFPGAVYRNKTQLQEIFIATDTASVQIFCNIFATGIETFVIPWDQLLYTVS